MGVGIGAAKEVTGGLASVGVASRMIDTQIDSDVKTAKAAKIKDIEAQGQLKQIEEHDMIAAQLDAEGAEKKLDDTFNDLNNLYTKNGNLKKGVTQEQERNAQNAFTIAGYDLEKAKAAISSLQTQQKTLALLRGQYQEQIAKGARWGGKI